jgi:hypothetical protein
MRRERRPASAVDCSTALPAQASSVPPLGKRQAHAQQQQISFPHKRQCAWVPAGPGSQRSELSRTSNAAPAATPASGCQSASVVPWPAERRQGSDQPRCARGFANLDHAPQPAARRLPLASAGPSQHSSAGSGGAAVPPDTGTRRSSAASAAAFTWPGASTGVAGEPLAVTVNPSPDSSARSASTAAAPGVAAPLSAVSCPPAQAWPLRAPATALPGPAARPATQPAAARRPATRLRLSLLDWGLPCSVVQARSSCRHGAAARARTRARAGQQGSPLCPLVGDRGAVARTHDALGWQGRWLGRAGKRSLDCSGWWRMDPANRVELCKRRQAYASRGVRTMYPWQAAALEGGERGGNLVYCAPTSGGKSLVAEVLLLRRLLAAGDAAGRRGRKARARALPCMLACGAACVLGRAACESPCWSKPLRTSAPLRVGLRTAWRCTPWPRLARIPGRTFLHALLASRRGDTLLLPPAGDPARAVRGAVPERGRGEGRAPGGRAARRAARRGARLPRRWRGRPPAGGQARAGPDRCCSPSMPEPVVWAAQPSMSEPRVSLVCKLVSACGCRRSSVWRSVQETQSRIAKD